MDSFPELSAWANLDEAGPKFEFLETERVSTPETSTFKLGLFLSAFGDDNYESLSFISVGDFSRMLAELPGRPTDWCFYSFFF